MNISATKVFYDAEFTGLHQATTLISIALCADDGRTFYAEFSDFDIKQCDHWIKQHVLTLTRWADNPASLPFTGVEENIQLCYGDSSAVKTALLDWLSAYDAVEIWADCPAWDWVLFCELFGGALQLPQHIFYMPFDLATLFHCKGLDADTPRVQFALEQGAILDNEQCHNALFDAQVTQLCHGFLMAPVA